MRTSVALHEDDVNAPENGLILTWTQKSEKLEGLVRILDFSECGLGVEFDKEPIPEVDCIVSFTEPSAQTLDPLSASYLIDLIHNAKNKFVVRKLDKRENGPAIRASLTVRTG